MHIFFVSFRGQKTLEPRTDQSPLAVLISKFPTSIPTLSHAQSPPPPGKTPAGKKQTFHFVEKRERNRRLLKSVAMPTTQAQRHAKTTLLELNFSGS